MKIEKCTHDDIDRILTLYEAARNLQTAKSMVVWPIFEPSFVAKEIEEGRQWKIIIDNEIACNWAITFEDKEIWEEMDQNDAIYIHRICTEPRHRGNRFIDAIVLWAKHEAIAKAPSTPKDDNEHKPGTVSGHFCCAYCALYSTYSRTSFKCMANGCGIPLCCVGHGKAERDCFNIVHSDSATYKATKLKFEVIRKSYNKNLVEE